MLKVNGVDLIKEGFFYVTDAELKKIPNNKMKQRPGFAYLYKDEHCKGTQTLRIANTQPARYVVRCGRGWYQPIN